MSLGAAQTLTPKLDHRPQNQPVLPPGCSRLYDIWKKIIDENQKKIWRMVKNNNFGGNLIRRMVKNVNFGGKLIWQILADF